MGRIEKTVFISYRRANLPWAKKKDYSAVFSNCQKYLYLGGGIRDDDQE